MKTIDDLFFPNLMITEQRNYHDLIWPVQSQLHENIIVICVLVVILMHLQFAQEHTVVVYFLALLARWIFHMYLYFWQFLSFHGNGSKQTLL